MTLRYPWMGLLVLALALAMAGAWLVRRRRGRRRWQGDAPVANVAPRAAGLPAFRRVRRRQRLLLRAEVTALVVAGGAATVLAMRPMSHHAIADQAANRDVMLCLDVSGSMEPLDVSILDHFAALVADLAGERIGLTIWNGSAVTVFPLTDDSEYVAATLAEAAVAIGDGDPLYLAGTIVGGSSLIADGLAACVLRFDRPDEDRARSIVFATDNAVAGTTILTLTEAATMARDRAIHVYGVAVKDHITDQHARELAEAAAITGGAYLVVDDAQFVDDVVARIRALEATPIDRPAGRGLRDDSAPFAVVAVGAAAALVVIGWALRR